jgi:hypothetical protein
LRLLIALAAQPPAGDDDGEIRAVIGGIREEALTRLRAQLALAFGDQDSLMTDRLARFAPAAIDGAFLASQTDGDTTLRDLLAPLAPALVAARRALRGR